MLTLFAAPSILITSYKKNLPPGCQPQHKACPPAPIIIGQVVIPQKYQYGYIFNVDIAYLNP